MRPPLLAAAAATLLAGTAAAQSTPLTTTLISNAFSRPVLGVSPPGDTDRLFIVEENAADIEILNLGDNSKNPVPFLDLNADVNVSTSGERGLLGMAFHPDYDSNGFFYVNYTNGSGNTVIRRYTVSGDPDLADTSTDLVIINISQPFSNHNAGMLEFGPDGMLWIGLGDGGSANDPQGNGQNPATLLAKMLRLDVDNPSGGNNYGIPADNPFLGAGAVLDEIWALGLRNPFRHSFDMETGDLWIGDVGQNSREEVDFVSAATIDDIAAGSTSGPNFGWRCMEGFDCTGLSGCTCNAPSLTLPVEDFNTGFGGAVIGGYVYRGDAIPDLDGAYFYSNYGNDKIWSLRVDDNGTVTEKISRENELDPPGGLSLLNPIWGQDASGEVYVFDHTGGEIFKIVPDGPFTGIGSALAGADGEPTHFGTGGVQAGQSGALHLRDAAPGALAGLFMSFNPGSLPFKGGTLAMADFFALIILNTDGNGEIDITWTDTGGAPAGTTLITQFAIQDAGAPVGVALSNALETVWS